MFGGLNAYNHAIRHAAPILVAHLMGFGSSSFLFALVSTCSALMYFDCVALAATIHPNRPPTVFAVLPAHHTPTHASTLNLTPLLIPGPIEGVVARGEAK